MPHLTALPVAAFLAFGAAVGIGVYTFTFAKGASYLTNDPAACANCHVMRDYYAAWEKGSHHTGAVCNDCHTPANVVGKYATKALNGFNHSVAFTFGTYEDTLSATSLNKKIAEASCRKCHQPIVSTIEAHAPGQEQTRCVRCHGDVGHPR